MGPDSASSDLGEAQSPTARGGSPFPDVRIVDALVVAKRRDGSVRVERPSAVANLAQVAIEYGLTEAGVEEIAAGPVTPDVGLAVLVEHVQSREAVADQA
jgi:hypothetical protein